MINREIVGLERERLEAALIPHKQWEGRVGDMPEWAQEVVRGERGYCGCEGIGYLEDLGWYMVLWEPNEDPEPNMSQPLVRGLTLVSVSLVNGPTKADPGKVTLLYTERGV